MILEGNTLWLKCISPLVEIHVRTTDNMIIFQDFVDNIILKIDIIYKKNVDKFIVSFGDVNGLKYAVRFPIKQMDSITKELQPLFNYLKVKDL
jgi:hypothetical protein